jgi:GNAT superfamily N-acetyltransferase
MSTVALTAAAVRVRAVDHSDVGGLERMFGALSDDSLYFRFFSPLPRVPSSLLRQIAEVDHDRTETLVAVHGDAIVAVASYGESTAHARSATREAELSIVVADAWHRRGIGMRLLRAIAALAFERGFGTLVATTLPTNRAALGLVTKIAPAAAVRFADGLCETRLTVDDLAAAGPPFVTPPIADRHYPHRAA